MQKRIKKYKKSLAKLFESLKKEFKSHKKTYILLTLILLAGLFIRVYRTGQILYFFYDQGRDALVIWDFLYKGKMFLIGPTTGIAGIFRGPFYYWLITPIYWISGGNPVWAANFLALISMVAVGLLYYLGLKIQDRTTGLIGATIASLSFYIMVASRWLSNPTPMLLLSLLLIWAMILVSEGKRWAWVIIAFLAGSSLFHFGSSGEFFYFPAIFVFALWQRKNFPNIKILLISIFAFAITALPLVLFDIRHDGLLSSNIADFIFNKGSFKSDFNTVASERFNFYNITFTNKIFNGINALQINLMRALAVLFFIFLPKFLKSTSTKIIILMLLSPVVGLLFFQGNEGNIYDYYLTGYYLIFILLVSLILGQSWRYLPGKVFVVIFMYFFFQNNLPIVRNRIVAGVDGPTTIAFGNQKQAIEWVYQDAQNQEFNVDVYVPPVIPYAYDYLFKWYGGRVMGREPKTELVSRLYTLYEVDPPHPERLEAWLARQKGIGVVEEEKTFGGIVVQRRRRI